MSATQSVKYSNISATTAAFQLKGGKYGVALLADNFGTVKLQVMAADNTTYVSIATALDFAADSYVVADLPPGQYRLTVDTADAIYASITSIPLT